MIFGAPFRAICPSLHCSMRPRGQDIGPGLRDGRTLETRLAGNLSCWEREMVRGEGEMTQINEEGVACMRSRASGTAVVEFRKLWGEGPGKLLVPQESLHYPRKNLSDLEQVIGCGRMQGPQNFRQAKALAYPGCWDFMMQFRGLLGLHSYTVA
jgi:hypothetical protein